MDSNVREGGVSKKVSEPGVWRIILLGRRFRKSKVQNIYDDHKIGIFQFPMVYMELKAKMSILDC